MERTTQAVPDRQFDTPAGTMSTTQTQAGERRETTRHPCGGPIWWKTPDTDRFQQGWLIERSQDGTAFLIRGGEPPFEGVKIELSTSDPTDIGFRVDEALIRRTSHVHADLYLVAAQVKLKAADTGAEWT